MQKIKILLIKIALCFLNILYAIIKFFPTRNEITLISRQSNEITLDFEILRDELVKEHPNYRIMVLTKKLDNKLAYIFHMFKQMYHIARSRVVILDSYCIVISVLKHKKNLKVIQIWHSIGSMKKFGYAMLDKEEGSSSSIAKVMHMHRNYDVVLISSKFFVKDFIEGFRINDDIIVEIPLPRVDRLLDKKYQKKKREELYSKIPKLKNKKNILYCSTFRKGGQVGTKNIDDLVDNIDFNKYNLLYKPHPFNNTKANDKRIITDFKSTFEALSVADYVICDYSSMIYEVGLLNIPIYLYAYDWDEYKNKREINFDIEKDTGLLFTKDAKKIIKTIEQDNYNFEKWNRFVKKNVAIPKEGCTKKIIDLINSYL